MKHDIRNIMDKDNVMVTFTLPSSVILQSLKHLEDFPGLYSVRDITWIGAIKCTLHQVEVGTCTSDTWSKIGHLAKCIPQFRGLSK